MKDESFLAIVNPKAGGGRCGKRAPMAIEELRRQGLDIDVVYTSRVGEASELARSAQARGICRFIAVGGDGTGYEIVNGLFPIPSCAPRPTLGFLPLGTGNSFLRDFSTNGAALAKEALVGRRSRPCDVVRLVHDDGELFYINLLSFGFVADVCATRNARFSPWGELGYVLSVLTEMSHLKLHEFNVRVNEGEAQRIPAIFLSVSNSRFTGGKMMMAPHADTGDGLADLIEVGAMGRVALLRAFPKIFKGTHVHLSHVRESHVRTMEFLESKKISAMVDGEVTHLVPRKLEVLPDALKVSV